MKVFTLFGTKTLTKIEMEDDEMMEWKIIKIKDYEARQ